MNICLFLIGLLLTGTCFALQLTIPSVFADLMILQRDQKLPLWGTSDVSSSVAFFAGQRKRVVTDEDVKWRIYLDALKTS